MRKVPNTIWTRAENGQNLIQKTLSRYLWNPPKTIFWAARAHAQPIKPSSIPPLESLRNRFELWPWNTRPKASNSSKIRAQVMRNSSQKKCLTLPTERSKKLEYTVRNRCRQPSRKAWARCLWRSGSDRPTQQEEVPWRSAAIVKSPTVRPQSSATTF